MVQCATMILYDPGAPRDYDKSQAFLRRAANSRNAAASDALVPPLASRERSRATSRPAVPSLRTSSSRLLARARRSQAARWESS